MPETQIAVINSRLEQMCRDLTKLHQNVEKLANGQETRLRKLEDYEARCEERWEQHWKSHVAWNASNDRTWRDHDKDHDNLKNKQTVADIVVGGVAVIGTTIAAIFGANR